MENLKVGVAWQNYGIALQGKIKAGVIRDDAQEYMSGIIVVGLQAIFLKKDSI